MLPITLRLGWATTHGPCLMDLAPAQNDALTRGALAVLGTPKGASVMQWLSEKWQSEKWQPKWTDFQKEPSIAYSLTELTQWRCLNRSTAAWLRCGGAPRKVAASFRPSLESQD